MKRCLLCLAAFLALLAQVASADQANLCLVVASVASPVDAIALSLLALTVSFDVIAIAYILSKIFPHTGLREWINKEYWEIAKTAMLIISIYAILSIVGNIAPLITGLPSTATGTAVVAGSSAAASTQAGTGSTEGGGFGGGQGFGSGGTTGSSAGSSFGGGGTGGGGSPTGSGFGGGQGFGSGGATTGGFGGGQGFGGEGGGSTTTTCTTGACGLITGACTYLNTEKDYLATSLQYLMSLSEGLGVLKMTTISAYLPIPLPFVGLKTGFVMPLYQNTLLETTVPGIAELQSVLNDVLNILATPLAFLISAQLALIPILFFIGLAFLIPFGLMLRAFPFVRGVGGTLIAVGIGVSLVYPSLLVLFNAPVTYMLQGQAITTFPQISCAGSWIICGIAGVVFSIFSTLPALTGLGDAFQGLYTIYPALSNILYYSAYLMLQLVLFALDLTIGYPLVDSIARALGGSIRLQISGKIKLT